MSWTLPLPMLLFADIVALCPLPQSWCAGRRHCRGWWRRPSLEVIAAVWAMWITYWLLEQRR